MKKQISEIILKALEHLQQESILSQDCQINIQVDYAKDPRHGDYASNIALMLAKQAQMSPRDLAQKIKDSIGSHPILKQCEIAGPGFINFTLSNDARFSVIQEVLEKKERFGHSQIGQGIRIIQEFVSANPTGPLHVGHGRSAAFGSSLANLLRCAGYTVDCEYYVNDAGRQMDILAVSVWLRYLSLCGESLEFPCNAYKGAYVLEIAQKLYQKEADAFHFEASEVLAGVPDDENKGGDKERHIDSLIDNAKKLLGQELYQRLHRFGLEDILSDIKQDLEAFGVHYQQWFSEKSLFESQAIEKALDALNHEGHTYTKDDALWFNATAFGDEKDRVLKRANGQSTYFASDVAYHWNKYERGYDRVIDILGADHHGYVPRVKAAVKALGKDPKALEVPIVQFAILYRGKDRVQMSTRSGSFITLRQLREEVGSDAARFFYVSRKAEQHMDFDLELAKSQSVDNPVYYIQYAHARIVSVIKQLVQQGSEIDMQLGLSSVYLLDTKHEENIIRLLHRYPDLIEMAALHGEPHQLAYFLRELANELHSYYNAQKFIVDNDNVRNARLCLIMAVKQVLSNGLAILGVSAPEQM